MENDLIDREKVIKGLYACTTFGEDGATDGDCKICPYDKGYATGECWVQMNRDAIDLLKEWEAAKPKTGHWVFESAYYEAWSHTCSECGKRMTTAINTYANWCWNCGAKMEGR